MSTIINGDSPSITFSDSTTQTTAFTTNPIVNNIKSQASTALTFAINATEAGRFDTGGAFLVGGQYGSSSKIIANAASGDFYRGYNSTTLNFSVASTGTIYAQNTSIQSLSDRTQKENIVPIPYGLQDVLKLNPVKYDFISNTKNNLGFIAQDVQKVIPELVGKVPDSDILLSLKMGDILPVVVKAIQELKAEFDTYKASHP